MSDANRPTAQLSSEWAKALALAFVHIRNYAYGGDLKKIEAIADAFHNIPAHLAGAQKHYTLLDAIDLYLVPLAEELPEFREVVGKLRADALAASTERTSS